jgi:ATP-dependent exoDNAse (exonuclease V) alpha subunit
MAIYHFSVGVVQRSAGRSVVATAAYRSCTSIYNECLKRASTFPPRPDHVYSEILLAVGAPERWQERGSLWNEVERVELRTDSSLAREIEIALPGELSEAAVIALARDFVREQFVALGMIADLNIYWRLGARGDAQPYAHILLTMRRISAGFDGHPENRAFGTKAREWNERSLIAKWRASWAELANARLAEAGFAVRIDHRSNSARGMDLDRAPHEKTNTELA